MGLLFKNNAETTLSSGINNSTTTIPVASAAVFPTPNANNKFFATLDDGSNIEVVLVTAISSNDLTVVRAQDNTSAAAFGSGTKIELRLTAKVLETGTTSLTDLDGDTKIEVEATADSDTIIFTANGGDFNFVNSSNTIAIIKTTNDDFIIQNNLNDKDFKLKGYDSDGGGLLTALSIDYSDGGAATFSDDVNLGDNKQLNFGVGADLIIQSDGTDGIIDIQGDLKIKGNHGGSVYTALLIDVSDSGKAFFNGNIDVGGGTITRTGDFTLDVSGAVILDADDNGNVSFKDGGTRYGYIEKSSNDMLIQSTISDGDIVFKGNDGGSTITPFKIDMSSGGRALFFSDLLALETVGQYLQMAATGGTYWAIGSTGGSNPPSTPSSTLAFHHYDGSAWNNEVEIDGSGNITLDGNIVFSNNSKVRQDSAGLIIETLDSDEDIFFSGNDGGSAITAVRIDMSDAGAIICNGNITAFGNTSDIRLKENVEVIPDALNKLQQLKGITFNYKKDGKRSTGLIAQDLEKVLPEAVYETIDADINGDPEDKHLAIRYGNTVGLLVEAIKELEARVKELEGK